MAKSKRITRLYLNGHLHAVIHINRAADLVTLYDFVTEERKVYPWSDVKRKMQNAFTITEAAKLVNRHRDRMWQYLQAGDIEYPQREHNLETKRPGRYLFSEDDVLDVHEYLAGIHIGRPRKDGRITNNSIPTREELRAMLRSRNMLYVKEGDKFVPVWKQEEW